MIRTRIWTIQHINNHSIDTQFWQMEPIHCHVRSWVTQFATTLFTADHLTLDAVPMAQLCGRIPRAPI